ncbi:MAG: hypothetical protein OXJ56_02895 [Rhodospirillaceae bacterium]|nr:hypothetical protein [Rhodospirillaceae bacterium]
MRKLTCYAWGKPGDWEALCVDLDLAAQGENLEEVRRELGDAIQTYLDYVADLPENEQARFLDRKAPLRLRLQLALKHRAFYLLNSLKIGATGRELTRAGFVVTPTS